MKYRLLTIAIAFTGILAGVLYVVFISPQKTGMPRPGDATSKLSSAADKPDSKINDPAVPVVPAGRYTAYDEAAVSDGRYTTTILFFYASWCPECRAFDIAINESGVPDGVQIMKVDYDSATNLRQQYGVTIQTTFVRVSSDGAKQALWVGYGKDKSVDAILENTK